MTTTATIPPDAIRLALHRGQADVWRSRRRFRVVVAGRRWGKTHLVLTWMITQALTGKPGRYWYVAPTREDAKDILWADLKAAIDPSWLGGDISETELSVPFGNGAHIRLWSAEKGDSLRGRALRALVLDEYADMDAAIFSEILRPALADYRAPALFVGTPKSYNHFYDLFIRGQSADHPEWQSWQFPSLDNPFLAPREIAEARATCDLRTFRQEWEASFEALAGRAYYTFSRSVHAREPVLLEPTVPLCVSFDFNINPATAVLGQYRHDDAWVWREVFIPHAGGEATRACVTAARALIRDAHWTGQIRVYGDPSGKAMKTTGPSDHAVVREAFPGATWCIAGHAPHVRDRVAAVNGRCETVDGRRHARIDPTCTHLIADLEQVTFKDNGELDKTSNPMLTHVSDALGYWWAREWPARKGATAGAAWMEHLL